MERVSLDLIAGLPGQTESSWQESLDAVLASGVGHASIYMLEVDEGSRLGREVLAGGVRYGAGSVPDEDACVRLYESACAELERGGLAQYEISNFARPGQRSVHNLKYWRREPYLGFGLDAHSMLPMANGEAVRFSNTGTLAAYLAETHTTDRGVGLPVLQGDVPKAERVTREEALEETIFLGLRLCEGLHLGALAEEFGAEALARLRPAFTLAEAEGLVESRLDRGLSHTCVKRLTGRGRALSNEVFARLLAALEEPGAAWEPAAAEELARA